MASVAREATAKRSAFRALAQQAMSVRRIDPERSLVLAEQAMALANEIDDVCIDAEAWRTLAMGQLVNFRYPDALTSASRALVTYETLGDGLGQGHCYLIIAHSVAGRGEIGRAIESLRKAFGCAVKSDDLDLKVRTLQMLSWTYMELGAVEAARQYANEALIDADGGGLDDECLQATVMLSGLYLMDPDPDPERAVEHSGDALVLAVRSKALVIQAMVYTARSHALCACRRVDEAISAAAMAVSVAANARDRAESGRARAAEAAAWLAKGDLTRSRELLEQAVEDLADVPHETTTWDALRALASVREKLGDHKGAIEVYKRLDRARSQAETVRHAEWIEALDSDANGEIAQLAANGARRRARELETCGQDRDPLTDLMSREALIRCVEQKLGDRASVSAVVLDLDHFKRVNDRFGRPIGDRILCEVAGILRREAGEDGLSRWGGEEFVIALPNGDDAETIADRLRMAIERADWSGVAPELRTTATVVVVRSAPGESFSEAVERADRALYLGKRRGRNQVVAA